MGNSKYLDGLSQDERNALVKQLWNIQNHKCFICGEEIDLDIQTTNIDHIKPLANGGKDEPVNFAITHEHCNKSKQDADFEVAKRLYALEKIIIKIFDGQHKAVAQIVLGVKSIVVRLFINPDLDRLIETNTNAGSKLKQIAFDKAIVRQLHDTLYSERLRKYQQDHFLDEDFAFAGTMYNEDNLFQQRIPDQLWENIRTFIINLKNLPVWKDRSMAATIFGGKNKYDFWKIIFQTGKTSDGTQVLVVPLNVADMIKK